MSSFNFNAHTVKANDPDAIGNVWPAGEWPCVLVGAEPAPSKTEGNGYMKLTVQMIDGPLKNSTNIVRLNLWNTNQKAVEIAQGDLSALCHATGVFLLNSLDDFKLMFNKPFNTVWKPQSEKPEYTEFKGFKPHGPAVAAGGGQQPAQQPAQQPQPQTQSWAAQTPPAQQPQQQPQQAWGNQPPQQQQQTWGQQPQQPQQPAQQPAQTVQPWQSSGQIADKPAWSK